MKRMLLGTASAIALGLFATSAMAGSDDFWGHNYGKSATDNTSVAVGVQLNSVSNDGDITIGSQAETHSTSGGGGFKKDGGKDGHSRGHDDKGGSSGFFFFATYDHNDEGRVYNSNTIDNSFNHTTGLINVQQNNGNNSSQDAQNTVAAIIGCDCGDAVGSRGHGNDGGSGGGDNVAVAVGLQAAYVSNGGSEGGYGNIVVDVATQSNTVTGSFNNSTGLINVNQNNGNNSSQKAQSTVAAIIAKSK